MYPAVALVGARQSGKTTLAKSMPQAGYFDMEKDEDRLKLDLQWHEIIRQDRLIILDEAQNCTPMQMKMCLTRLGADSKMVVTGDITQIDLPEEKDSGLLEALEILEDVEGIGIHQFSEADVVRHTLVRSLVKAYEKSNKIR